MAHEYVAEAMDTASKRVAQMFQNPEQLEKVEQVKHQILRRKVSVDARLRSSVQAQLHDIRAGLFLLKRARDEVLGVKANLDDIETQYLSCRQLNGAAPAVRVLAEERNELKSTIEQLDQIFAVPDIVESLNKQLEDDDANLLSIHYELSKLEKCREQVLTSTKSGDAKNRVEVEEAIRTYFTPVSDLEKRLKQKMWFIARNPIDAVSQNPTKLVTVIRIIQREEVIDEKTERSEYRPKKWRKEFLDKVELQIENRFDTELFLSSATKFIAAFNGFYFQDLTIAKDELPSRFPQDYDIYNFYLQAYHNRLRIMVEDLKNNAEIQPHEIMILLNWMPVYNKSMMETLGVDVHNEFSQQLLDCSEDELRTTYLNMLSDKLTAWTTNLVNQEVKSWYKEGEEGQDADVPNTTPDGKFYTETTTILFQMLDSQIDVAFQPGGGPQFAKDLLSACFTTVNKYLIQYGEALAGVRNKFFGPSRFNRPPALTEYMMASINGNLRAVELIDEMLEKIGMHISAKELVEYEGLFKPVADVFEELSTQAITIVIDIVFSDLDEFIKLLFTPKWLRSKVPFSTIIATLKDYGDDFRQHLNKKSLKTLMESIATRVLIEYVKAMMSKRLSLKDKEEHEAFLNRMKEEVEALRKYCSDFSRGQAENPLLPDMSRNVEVLAKIYNIVVADKGSVNACCLKLKHQFPDITKEHFEALFTFREDHAPKEVKVWLKNVLDVQPAEDRKDVEFFRYFPMSS